MFSQGEGLSSKETQIALRLRRYYRIKGNDTLHQQKHIHQEQMAQQQWEAEHHLRVEATEISVQTSAASNDDLRAMEHDTSVDARVGDQG